MIRAFVRMTALSVALAALAPAVHAAQAKPLTEADVAEGQALINGYVVPLMTDIDTVVKLATTDQPKACALAKANEAKALELDTKVTALRDRLIAEGKTTQGFDKIIAGADQMKTGTHDTVRSICGGALTKTGNAEHDAMIEKMVRMSGRLTTAMNASIQADQRGDHAAACVQLREGDAAYDDLYAYLKELRARMANGTTSAAQMDATIAKVAPLKVQMTDTLKGCPAV